MANKIILNLNNGYVLAGISSQGDYDAKSSYLFVKQNEVYIPASGYEAGTSYYEINWQPLPTLQGYSVNLVAATSTTDTESGRTGTKISLYDEQSSTTNTFSIWNGKDGVGQVNTVDTIGVTPGGNNVDLQAVRYSSNQNLTDSQKIQARANIGAAPSDLSVNGITLGTDGIIVLAYDTALDSNSSNPVQNSVLSNKFTEVDTSIAAINTSINAANASIIAITPKLTTITTSSNSSDWTQIPETDEYVQTFAAPTGITLTNNTKIDLALGGPEMVQMVNDGIIGIYAVNNTTVSPPSIGIHVVGNIPTNNLFLHLSFVETTTIT